MIPPHLAGKLRILLENFLSQQPGSDDALSRFMSPLVTKYCTRHAPTMPCDLREDVLQESLLILIGSGRGSYDSGRNTTEGYVYNAVRTALQSVRRRHGWGSNWREAIVEVADLDAITPDVQVERREQAKILLHEILAREEPGFRALLWRVYVNGDNHEVALSGSGMSRFAFTRRRRALAHRLSALGRCA